MPSKGKKKPPSSPTPGTASSPVPAEETPENKSPVTVPTEAPAAAATSSYAPPDGVIAELKVMIEIERSARLTAEKKLSDAADKITDLMEAAVQREAALLQELSTRLPPEEVTTVMEIFKSSADTDVPTDVPPATPRQSLAPMLAEGDGPLVERLAETLIEGAKIDSVITNPAMAFEGVTKDVLEYVNEWREAIEPEGGFAIPESVSVNPEEILTAAQQTAQEAAAAAKAAAAAAREKAYEKMPSREQVESNLKDASAKAATIVDEYMPSRQAVLEGVSSVSLTAWSFLPSTASVLQTVSSAAANTATPAAAPVVSAEISQPSFSEEGGGEKGQGSSDEAEALASRAVEAGIAAYSEEEEKNVD